MLVGRAVSRDEVDNRSSYLIKWASRSGSPFLFKTFRNMFKIQVFRHF